MSKNVNFLKTCFSQVNDVGVYIYVVSVINKVVIWIISSRTRLFCFENGLYLEKWHFETNFEILSWIVGDYICLCAYVLLVIIYVYVHICCWWIIYVYMHICCWWWIVGVSMYWTMLVWICRIRMIYVLLLSSPKFTHNCCWFHSMLVANTYVFNYAGCLCGVIMMCLLHQGRRPRRWNWYHTYLESV